MRRTIWNHWRSETTDLSMKLPKTWRIHNVFHASLLQQYKENNIYRTSYSRPPVELNNEGQEVYNVETILKHWRRGRGYQYYVKWEGYLITKASLEPEGSFSNNGNILNQYKQCHQLLYEYTDPGNCFCVIIDWQLGRTQLALLRYAQSIRKHVLPVWWYKPLTCWLSLRIPSLWNPATCLFPTSPLKMPAIWTYERQSFAPFPIDYSSKTFTPLVKENWQISHVRYLLRGQHASLARFWH